MGRFRYGLILGFGAGYVAGSAAGRYRYEQIKGYARKAWDSDALKPIREQMDHRTISLDVNGRAVKDGLMKGAEDNINAPAQEPFNAAADAKAGTTPTMPG